MMKPFYWKFLFICLFFGVCGLSFDLFRRSKIKHSNTGAEEIRRKEGDSSKLQGSKQQRAKNEKARSRFSLSEEDVYNGAAREKFRRRLLSAMERSPEETLQALVTDVDHHNLYLVVEALTAFYKDSPMMEVIETIEFLREDLAVLHQPLVVSLLQNHAQNAEPQELVHFLEKPENQIFGLMAGREAGGLLANKEPEKLLSYLQTVESEEVKRELLTGASVSWMREDPAQALAYIQQNQGAEYFERAIERYIIDQSDQTPALTLELALSLRDSDQRAFLLGDAGQAFYNSDREAYYQWLQTQTAEVQSYLSHEEKAKWDVSNQPDVVALTAEERREKDEREMKEVEESNSN